MDDLFSFLDSSVGAAQVAPLPAIKEGVFDKCVVLNLKISALGTSRKLADDQYQTDAAKEKTSASKKICKGKELKAIVDLINDVRSYIRMRSIPTNIKGGLFAVLLEKVPEINDYISEKIKVFDNLVSVFIAAYPELQRRDSLPKEQGGLGSLYNARDYPAVGDLRDMFGIEVSWEEWGAPGKLREVSKQIFDEAQAKCNARFANIIEQGEELIMGQFALLLEHMRERLTGVDEKTGKNKKFKDSLVLNLREFLETFDCRNLSANEQLSNLVKQTAAALGGIEPDELRNSEVLRDKVRKTTDQIKGQLDTMIVAKPGRKIDLTSDEWGDI